MKLTKVIEIMELNLKEAGKKMPPDTATALAISIEADKRYQKLRSMRVIPDWELLPGETAV